MIYKKMKGALLTGAVCATAITGAFAYFSGTAATKENVFTIVAGEKGDDTAGTIEEPNWPTEDTDTDGIPDAAEDLTPGSEVNKDPQLTSNVDYESWVFLKVEVPTLNAQMEADSGVDKVYDSVTYQINGADWVDVTASVDGAGKSDTAGEKSVYVYAYNKKLAAGGKTSALFDKITVPEFTKTEAVNDSVDVSGALIQTEGYVSYTDALTALTGDGVL